MSVVINLIVVKKSSSDKVHYVIYLIIWIKLKILKTIQCVQECLSVTSTAK